MNKKVEIVITDGHRYDKNVNNGREFVIVGFWAGNYGADFPCDDEEDVKKAIKHLKEIIEFHGDKFIVVDKRVK
jgi:hypothetical protein